MPSLADLRTRIERLQAEAWRAKTAKALADKTRRLIDDAFSQEKSPYGVDWRARKGSYPWPALQKTGDMRNGWRLVKCDATGFKFTNTQFYAWYQYYGNKRGIYPRRMFPAEAFGLGDAWRRVYQRTIADQIRDLLRR